MACAVDRISRPELLRIEPFGPALRVIVQAHGPAGAPDIGVTGEGEIAKSEIARDFVQCRGKVAFIVDITNVADKRIHSIEHALTAGLSEERRQRFQAASRSGLVLSERSRTAVLKRVGKLGGRALPNVSAPNVCSIIFGKPKMGRN